MNTIRTLIADADVVVRHKVATILDQEHDIKCRVVSTDRKELVSRLGEQTYDVLLLDIEDRERRSAELLASVRTLKPTMPVVVLVSRTEHGAKLAIDALFDGAVDFLTKPEKGVNVLFADRHLKKRVGSIVRMAAGTTPYRPDAKVSEGKLQDEGGRYVSVFAIGGCSGAVPVLQDIIAGLDPSTAHVLIAQHLPRHFSAALATRLSQVSARPVVEAEDRDLLTSDRIWLAPGGHHLGIRVSGYDRHLHVHRGRRESGCRPSIDALFRSVADTFRDRGAVVVLSGCPGDGLHGSRAVREAGGRILVQDPATARVPDLPSAVISAGLASAVLSPFEIAEVINRSASGRPRPRPVVDRAAIFRNTVKDHDSRI